MVWENDYFGYVKRLEGRDFEGRVFGIYLFLFEVFLKDRKVIFLVCVLVLVGVFFIFSILGYRVDFFCSLGIFLGGWEEYSMWS